MDPAIRQTLERLFGQPGTSIVLSGRQFDNLRVIAFTNGSVITVDGPGAPAPGTVRVTAIGAIESVDF